MSALTVASVDRTRTFTPLGIRFWDAALDVPIREVLQVHAWLRAAPFAPVRAVRSPSGVYSFHGLPLRVAQDNPGTAEQPESLGPELEYTIAVDDPSGLYLPVAFSVTLPLSYRGEFLSGGPLSPPSSPPASGGRAYLFSAPARPIPPGIAAIRADLIDTDTGEPAAWAVMRVTLEGQDAIGIADQRGSVLVLAPLPTVERLSLGSPPGSAGGSLSSNQWPVTVRVHYEPAALRFPFANATVLPTGWVERPSLKSILDEQSAALIVTDEGEPAVSELNDDLVYGRELSLRTNAADGTQYSSVWITAGASIP